MLNTPLLPELEQEDHPQHQTRKCLDKLVHISVYVCLGLFALYMCIASFYQGVLYGISRPSEQADFSQIPNTFVLVSRSHVFYDALEIYPADDKGFITDASLGYVYALGGPWFEIFGLATPNDDTALYCRSSLLRVDPGFVCPDTEIAQTDEHWKLNAVRVRLGLEAKADAFTELHSRRELLEVRKTDESGETRTTTVQIATEQGVVVAQSTRLEKTRWLGRLLAEREIDREAVLMAMAFRIIAN